ncbi:MAG: DNA alkylation repair protein [Prevotella sp.]|jgi:3-methyladenine DNA glycosylase AlkD|nr:DNA alkylation repair protein [Prevotella sp.]
METIQLELEQFIDEEKRRVLPKFFKTGKGQYGEGDQFMGITVPHIRTVAMHHLDLNLDEIAKLLMSPWHEQRMCALLIMVEQVKRTHKRLWLKEHSEEEGQMLRRKYYQFYLYHTHKINNWDLVDLTAPTIVGEYLVDHDRDILYQLADSSFLWDQRIAVVSTIAFIRRNDFMDIYVLSEKLIHHPHDLMHKAIGWMLREAGKRDKSRLMDFLDIHSCEMPRTMLRYAIEKFPENERQYYLK